VAATGLLAGLLAVPLLRYPLHYGNPGFLAMHAAFNLSFICVGAVLAAFGEKARSICANPMSGHASAFVAVALLGLVVIDAADHGNAASSGLQHARLLVPLFEPLAIAWLIGNTTHQQNLGTRLLCWPPLVTIGTASYSLYLWQQAFTASPAHYRAKSVLMFPPLMVISTILSYRFVEQPCLRIAKRVLNSATAANVRASASQYSGITNA